MSEYGLWFIRQPRGWEWRNYRYGELPEFTPGPLRTPAQIDPIILYPGDNDPCIDTGRDRSPVQCSQCGTPDYAYRIDDDGLCTTCHRYKHIEGDGSGDWRDHTVVQCAGCGIRHEAHLLNRSGHCTKCFIDILDEDPDAAIPF